jgi:hypothetical protein
VIYTHLAAALVAGAVAAGGAWQVQEWRYGAKEADRLEEVARDRMRAEKNIDTAATGHERDKARIRTEFITITETVERIVREPFYLAHDAPACLDADGLRELGAAIRGPAQPASQPQRTLSRLGSPD